MTARRITTSAPAYQAPMTDAQREQAHGPIVSMSAKVMDALYSGEVSGSERWASVALIWLGLPVLVVSLFILWSMM